MNDTQTKTESVRLESEVVNRVREHVKGSRQTIGGFISYEIEKIMNRLDKKKATQSSK
jgi:hypothetical protein